MEKEELLTPGQALDAYHEGKVVQFRLDNSYQWRDVSHTLAWASGDAKLFQFRLKPIPPRTMAEAIDRAFQGIPQRRRSWSPNDYKMYAKKALLYYGRDDEPETYYLVECADWTSTDWEDALND